MSELPSSRPGRAPVSEAVMAPLFAAAEALSLDFDPEEACARAAIWGHVGGTKVAIGVRFVRGEPVGYAHYAEVSEPVVGPVTVEPWTGQARGRQPTGDAEIDDRLAIHGDPPVVRAWLDEDTRGHLARLFSVEPPPTSLVIERHRVTFRGPESLDTGPERVQAEVEALIAVVEAARLSNRPLLERVVHNALEDPERAVRERNAEVLGELLPTVGDDAKYGAAVRLLATDSISIDHRLTVLRIARGLPPERVMPLMQSMLDTGPLELARRAAAWVADNESRDMTRALVRALGRFDDAALARRIVAILGHLEDQRAQPSLLKLLDREDDGLRIEVAEALGRLGGAEAIPALEGFTKGFFMDRDLKRAAREAIERIQARGA